MSVGHSGRLAMLPAPSGGVRYIRSSLVTAVRSEVRTASMRWQSHMGEQRLTARHAKASYLHPLAPKDPSQRNVTLPSSFHARSGSPEKLTAEALKKEAQKALLLRLQQDVLWEGTVLDDRHNQFVQHFVRLGQNPKYRQSQRMLLVGGREMIRELCESGTTPKHLLITEGKQVPEWAAGNDALRIVPVSRQVADEIYGPGNDGYIGDFDIPAPPPLENFMANKQRLERVLVLDNVTDPGVLGTLLRTASGFQYDAIITTNHCADLYDHRTIRAARGAHFQQAVPIYTLRDEDGDDVYGLLNHIAARNDLLPVCFTPEKDAAEADTSPSESGSADGHSVFHSSVVGAKPVSVRSTARKLQQGFSDDIASAASPKEEETLSDFCLRRFTKHEDGKDRGYMLFAGPDHKHNMVKRVRDRVARPVTRLLLDDGAHTGDALIALSIVLHALRPAGNWDYLPVDERHDAPTMDLQTKTASAQIGANRLAMTEGSLNMDEEEQTAQANLQNEMRKWRRLRRKRRTDYDMWLDAETARVQEMLRKTQQQRMAPWKVPSPVRAKAAADGGMPTWAPNIVDEYRQPLDRDALRHEREVSENYVRPPNYDRFTE